MNNQTMLFNDILGKNARKSDPQPSKTAAKKMNNSGKRETNMSILLDVMRKDKKKNGRPKTSREWFFCYNYYFMEHGINVYELARRLSDLKHKSFQGEKLVVMEDDSIYCSISNKQLSAYSAVLEEK